MGNEIDQAKSKHARWQLEQIDSAPEELKPHVEENLRWRESAINAIFAKNKIGLKARKYRDALAERPDDPAAEGWRDRLAGLEEEYRDAIESVERLKEEAKRRDADYQDRVLEYRLSTVPESRREEARARLLEERQALIDAAAKAPIDGGEVGTAGGMVFGLELRLDRARAAGDEAEIERLSALLEPALVEKRRVEAIMDDHKAELEGIRLDYEGRLRKLVES